MSNQEQYENLCRKCFIRITKASKNTIKNIVLTKYKETCDCCGKKEQIVDYVNED